MRPSANAGGLLFFKGSFGYNKIMLSKNSLVLYKNNAAVVVEKDGEKYQIRWCSVPATPTGKKAVYSEQKVREKDFIVLSEEPCSNLDKVLSQTDGESGNANSFSEGLMEAYELFASDDQMSGVSLNDISEMATGGVDADTIFSVYQAVKNSLLFSLDDEAFKQGKLLFNLRTQEEIDSLKQKLDEKEHAAEIRAAFIQRLKDKKLNLPEDSRFMGEVENFALGKMEKSKTLEEAGFAQDIQKAHKLLIETGIWDFTKNPYPSRFGFSFASASEGLGAVPEEDRFEVPGIAYAIDAEHSTDPDDAISFDGEYLWVHIADPASFVMPDSPVDIAARNRGTTLYIPEGASRMLCEEALEDYALGLKEISTALSFKVKFSPETGVESCEVLKTRVHVKRLTYKSAEEQKDSDELKVFFEIARQNLARRNRRGAVSINFPEVHITVDKETKKVTIVPEEKYESNAMIMEMMLLAGEGAAKFAEKNNIPFPFVGQEAPEFPESIPEGFAGDFARIKCMRKRSVGITPMAHAGLGLSVYTQVTSPLRRYGDLVAHEQLRAYLDGRRLLDKDDMLFRVSAGDAASIAAKKASRLSDTHWKLVFLIQNPDWTGDAYVLDHKGSDTLFLIPSLDMQTTMSGCSHLELNEKVTLKMERCDISTQEVIFQIIS